MTAQTTRRSLADASDARLLYDAGLTVEQVGHVMGISRTTARRLLCDTGYTSRAPESSNPLTSASIWGRVRQDGQCWTFTGYKDNGYGRITVARRVVILHRYVYEQMVGEIPAGLQLDHLCLNRACVNPQHLDPVPGEVNARRAHEVRRRRRSLARAP